MQHISPIDAHSLASSDDSVVLLDCREARELEIAAIPGALHLPMSEIPRRFGELNADRQILVFCHSGIRSQSVTRFLEDQGFPRVFNVVGGIDAWSTEVDSTIPRY